MRGIPTVAVATALALTLAGCADQTGLLVEVTADGVEVPADVDRLRFEAVSGTGRVLARTFDLDGTWPASLTIVPADDADKRAELTITVTGLRGGDARVTRVIEGARFRDGETVVLRVSLTADCLDVACPAGVDCVAGTCVDGTPTDGGVDAGPPADGGVDAGPLDAGAGDAGPDGGAGDAGDAGGEPDSGTEDAGSDAGTDAGAGGLADHLVISEVATEGPAGLTDEFVELYNPTGSPIDISGATIEYRAGSGVGFTVRATVPTGAIIPAHGFYLVAADGYSRPSAPDLPAAWSSYLSSSDGHVRLVLGGTELDRLGWGSAVAPEGAPQPRLTEPGLELKSYERKALSTSTAASMGPGGTDELRGNGWDTDDNAADFVHRTGANPQNSAVATESL